MPITIEELRKRLRNVQKETIPRVEEAMQTAMNPIVAGAKRDCTPGQSRYYRAPYSDDDDPGRQPPHMRDTIEGHVITEKNVVSGIVGTWKDYAIYVHEGTQKMPPRPFLLDNIIDNRDNTLEVLSEALGELIQEQTTE